jgi:hypothetical protein
MSSSGLPEKSGLKIKLLSLELNGSNIRKLGVYW